ncbi:MAG: nitrile hydratase accessory protein [Pseudomonadota bacterium]
MPLPDDPLAPKEDVFSEPWHAQVLASAHALVREGHITPTEWADALGAALRRAEAGGAPDTDTTYYLAALEALEHLVPVPAEDLKARKAAWAQAYRQTPHGEPVVLQTRDSFAKL